MKRPALFFDRDNTLIINDGYLANPADVRLMDGAAQAIASARAMGYLIVTVSNQSGVARGLHSEADVHAVNARLDQLLRAQNPAAIIDRHEFCPDHPQGVVAAYRRDSDRRKPGAGMIHSAAGALDIDLAQSWLIGDAPRDIEAGRRAGLRTILFHHPDLAASPASAEPSIAQPDFTTDSLTQAVEHIQSAGPAPARPAPVHETDNPGPSDGSSSRSPITPMTNQNNSSASSATQPTTDPSQNDPARAAQQVAQLILRELGQPIPAASDFSVSRLLAGITQILAIAALFFAYLNRASAPQVQNILLLALVLQTMTITLLLMNRLR